MVKISACIVCHNDEKQIEKCLSSIKGVVDEIIVVHDGKCADDTLKIARKYTQKVFEGKQLGNPEPHRVTTFKKAKYDWLLIIDPDEYLPKRTQKKLKSLIDEDSNINTIELLWRLWDGEKYLTKDWPHRVGLIRKSKLRFLAILHPEWRADGEVVKSNLQLEHRPSYNNYTWKTFNSKWKKWLKLHAAQILTPIDEIPQYQYDKDQFVRHIEWIKKFDLMAAPFIFFYFLVGALVRAPKPVGWFYAKYSFLQAAYYFLLSVEVFKLKRNLL